jgi:acyl-CoA reductase-like NAD-dependent aldehyde dehydrogenase|tara:strand:+ start:127 stop:1617 length:1491 start_codon:yes stop_codon:yes gene_type:complete
MSKSIQHSEIWTSIVDGKKVFPKNQTSFAVHEPPTGLEIAQVVNADAEVVAAAVASSRHAFENTWGVMSPRERGAILRQVARKLQENAEELADLEAMEVGKPKRDAGRFDVAFSHACFDYFAGLTDTLHGEILDQGPIEARIVYEPYGVVAAILPFNWPPIHFAKKSAPALAAGNTVIIKPGEQAPLSVLRMTEIANEVLPPGVLNAVTGMEAGPLLVGNKDVERVTFTGATATGIKVLKAAAENVTFATMELGGKNALIVMSDADLEVAVDVAIEGMFYNQGEACTSTARILVDETIHDEFLERFTAATEKLVVGDGRDAATDIGAMVDAKQRDRVLGYLQSAVDEGARIVGQGSIPTEERLKDGFWVAPTVLADVTENMRVAKEEIFGPIACVMKFSDIEEAIRITNDSEYGLTAAIVTRNEDQAWKLSRRLRVGMVFVNNYMRRSFLGAPFGGVKGSGFGRENAIETLHEFVRSKNVRFPSGKGAIPTWPPVD